MSDRKKPSWIVWATAVLLFILPPLYFASVGPSSWCLTHGIVSADTYASYVKPYKFVERHSPAVVSGWMKRYRTAFTNLELDYEI